FDLSAIRQINGHTRQDQRSPADKQRAATAEGIAIAPSNGAPLDNDPARDAASERSNGRTIEPPGVAAANDHNEQRAAGDMHERDCSHGATSTYSVSYGDHREGSKPRYGGPPGYATGSGHNGVGLRVWHESQLETRLTLNETKTSSLLFCRCY